jgi:hypothetical protein
MDPEVPLPCLQQPETGHYLEPDEFNPHPTLYFCKINFIIILVYQMFSSLQVSSDTGKKKNIGTHFYKVFGCNWKEYIF